MCAQYLNPEKDMSDRAADPDAARLAELHRYQILDTPGEEQFDRLTRLAADIFGTPMATISLVDSDRQWFKSRIGIEAQQTPREIAFCEETIQTDEVMIVPDAFDDPRFFDNPLVIGNPGIRFYAGAPLISSNGQRIGALCALDRRARRVTPEQINALKDLAAVAIDEMELRLAMAKEEQLRKEAERASIAKSQFLSRMSHEIRTPLATVIGYSDLILLGDGPSSNEYAQKIRNSAHDLLFLLDNILDLTKIDYGKLSLENEPFNLADQTRMLMDSMSATATAGGQEFNFILETEEPGLEAVRGDVRRFRQILANIVGNAMKFAPGAAISVSANLTAAANPSQLAFTCSIEDRGPGIPEEKAAQIFEVFEQVDDSTQREKDGPGLGLPIAQALAEMMHGQISVESELGKGSKFQLSILLDRDLQADLETALPEVEENEPPLPLAGKELLLVEDNATNAKMISAILQTWGCSIVTAENGFVALDRLRDKTPDIVLLDLHMPKLDGWQTLQHIRADYGPSVRVLALTADAFEETRHKCLEAGFDGFISKPIDWGALYLEIGTIIERAA